MGCFSGCLMSTASDQKLFCKLCSPFCCSFDEFVEEKVISPSYSSAILTPPPSSFTFIKRLFISSSLSALWVMSFAYLKLLMFLPAILIPACAFSSPAFLMMYSAHKLNKQGDKIQPWCTPFPIWNQSVGPCPDLTVDSWPAYRFLKRWVGWSGIPISFRIFHSLLWSTQLKALA